MRVFLTPCIVLAMYHNMMLTGIMIFLCASFTDFLDGYFARLYEQESELGKVLDPVADKFLLIGTLSALHFFCVQNLIPWWFLSFLLVKDLLLLSIGGYILHCNYQIIPPSWLSKTVTTISMIFVVYAMCVTLGIASKILISPLLYCLSIAMILILCDYGYAIARLKKL